MSALQHLMQGAAEPEAAEAVEEPPGRSAPVKGRGRGRGRGRGKAAARPAAGKARGRPVRGKMEVTAEPGAEQAQEGAQEPAAKSGSACEWSAACIRSLGESCRRSTGAELLALHVGGLLVHL